MDLDELEVGKKYKYVHSDGKTYFATVVGLSDKRVSIKLGDIVNEYGDKGDPIYALGTLPPFETSADRLEKM